MAPFPPIMFLLINLGCMGQHPVLTCYFISLLGIRIAHGSDSGSSWYMNNSCHRLTLFTVALQRVGAMRISSTNCLLTLQFIYLLYSQQILIHLCSQQFWLWSLSSFWPCHPNINRPWTPIAKPKIN